MTVTLTQSQFDAIPTLAKQVAQQGLVIKKFDGANWYRLTYNTADQNGNWDITVDQILRYEDIMDQHQQIGQSVVNQLFQKLKEQNLSQADEATMINTVQATLVALYVGAVKGARVIANLTPTDGSVFTAARKTYLLAQIDAAITQLL